MRNCEIADIEPQTVEAFRVREQKTVDRAVRPLAAFYAKAATRESGPLVAPQARARNLVWLRKSRRELL